MVRVRIEPRAGLAHAADPVHGRDAGRRAARGGDAATHLGPRIRRVNRLVGGVQELADVHRRCRRAKPPRLVRLVPDEPLVDPAVVVGGGSRELGERGRPRREVGRPAAVRPARRADEADDRGDAAVAQPVQNEIALLPVLLAAHGLDPVPVEVEADDVHPEALQPVEPVVKRAGAVDEPGVVLDSVAHAARGLRHRGSETDQGAQRQRCEEKTHWKPGSPSASLRDTSGSCKGCAPPPLARLHERHVAHRGEPDVGPESESRQAGA